MAKSLNLTETQVRRENEEFNFKLIPIQLKVKIWFQNRRTKFKRKYTSDVEALASHYYSSLGIGGIARPMVVGDRLWLFTQPVSSTPPTPVQSMLLNNMPPSPQHYSPMITSRPYSGSPLAPSTSTRPEYNSSYLSKTIRPEYRFNREPADFRFNKVLIKSPPEESFHLSPHSSTNGLADLESRFGQNSSILNTNRKFQDTIAGDDVKSSSSSDVDCEEIEINDED